MLSGNFAEMTTSTPFRILLLAANLRHGTDALTSPPKEGVLRIFSPFKIRGLRPGLNPRTWVLKTRTLSLDHWRKRCFGKISHHDVHELMSIRTCPCSWKWAMRWRSNDTGVSPIIVLFCYTITSNGWRERKGLISSAEFNCIVMGWEMQRHKIQLQNTSCYIFLSVSES